MSRQISVTVNAPRRGVNIAGAEFGNTVLPGVLGTHYTFNSAETIQYFAERGLGLLRFGFQWERLQPVAGGPLDAAYLGHLKEVVAWAQTAGALLIPQPHNFGRYREKVADKHHLADLWLRLSAEFRSEDAVYAYDLMNEPHDLRDWKKTSQFVLSAIRETGDATLIMIPGDRWSSAQHWVKTHGRHSWIDDPLNNFLYEAHQYFDEDGSGAYRKTYDEELARNPDLPTIGTTRVRPFLEWCRFNNVRGYLGEYGVPGNDARWLDTLDDLLTTLDAEGIRGTYWAAGEWWGDYPLSVQPDPSFTIDKPQMGVLLRHL